MSTREQSKVSVPIAFAHRLLAPRLVCLIGSCSSTKERTWNVAPFSNVVVVSNVPQRVGIAIYKEGTTYNNILALSEFTINMPDDSLIEELWLAGHNYNQLQYPRDLGKMDLLRLTSTAATSISVPVVTECFATLECRLIASYDLGDHQFFVGDVLYASLRADLQSPDWRLPLNRILPVLQNSGNQLALPTATRDLSTEQFQQELNSRVKARRASF